MNEDRITFRDRLIAADLPDNVTVENLTKEIAIMSTRELTPFIRIVIVFVMLFALAIGGLCANLAITQTKLPVVARLGLATGTLFGLAWFAFSIAVLRRGKMDVKLDSHRVSAMVWVFTVLMTICFLMAGFSIVDRRQLGLMMAVYALTFLVMAAVQWISSRIESSELSTREHLLRIELLLAEGKEAGFGRRDAGPGGGSASSP